jgi:hypothetical protein
MTITGLGVDGYFRIQKESVYNTPITTSMTDLPIDENSLMVASQDHIENKQTTGSRLMFLPDSGRKRVKGDAITLNLYPNIIGELMNIFLGAASTAANGSAYDHRWFGPLTGARIGKSMTIQQALGAALAEQYSGCIINSIELQHDNENNVKVIMEIIGKDWTTGVARVSSFTWPATTPFNWSFGATIITPNGESPISPCIQNFSAKFMLNYDVENFCQGDLGVTNPDFQTVPSVEASLGITANDVFRTYAQNLTDIKVVATFTSTEIAAGSTVYKTVLEIPKMVLDPETQIPNILDKQVMDLSLTSKYGGTTTNSGGANKLFEILVTDATASYS